MSSRPRRLAALVAVAFAAVAAAPAASIAAAPVVHTDRGDVAGERAGGVDRFLGLPYAAAPVGERRWRPPAPAPSWTGVRSATAFGNTCPAKESTNGPRSETEDCLFANVWRPAGVSVRDKRPVYVFIHGGGLVNGSSNQADMAEIVRRTGVVGVSFNYRLGVFGFLATPGLTAESDESGNYGLMDQQAALRWVRHNIAAFGGRPGEVTVGGESAGGWSVCTHLVAPGSEGLLSQAMIQSGSCPSRTEAEAETAGTSVAGRVGCPSGAPACLRAVGSGELIDAFGDDPPLPVRGTPFLPRDPRAAIASGDFQRVPVVVGANRDEGRTFAQGFIGADEDAYEAFVTDTFGAGAADVLAEYPWPADANEFTAAYLVGAIQTDSGIVAGIGGCSNLDLTRDLARSTRTYAYEFANRTGPGLVPIPGYVWGAGHAIELAYLFPSFDNGVPITPQFDAGERRLAIDMKRYWGAFARTGAPRVNAQQAWPAYDTTGLTLSLRPGSRSALVRDATLAAEHRCAFWAAHA